MLKFAKKEPNKLERKQDDLTYGRLFFEEKFYLNKSATKWIAIGVKPLMNGVFTRVFRIVDKNGIYLTFNVGQISELFTVLSEVKALKNFSSMNNYDDDEEECEANIEGQIRIEKSDYNNQVYTVENDGSEEKITQIALGLKSLQRLCQLEDLIYFSYKKCDYIFAKGVFFELIEAAQKMPLKDRNNPDRLRRMLLNKAIDRYEMSEACPHYLIARDTLAKFEDFFHFMVNKQDENGDK